MQPPALPADRKGMYERGYRSLGRMVLILLCIPAFFYLFRYCVSYATGPTLYEGDRVEERSCRQCDGTGRDTQMHEELPGLGDRCPFCSGKGKVDVIIPGPKRPTRIWGAVVDLEASGGHYAFFNPSNIRMISLQAALVPPEVSQIHGAIAGVKVVFETSGGERIEVKTDPTGRFSVPLPPGAHGIGVTHGGFQELRETVAIPPLTAPIWLEKATLVSELPPEESQSAHGLSLLAALARPGKTGAFARIGPIAY